MYSNEIMDWWFACIDHKSQNYHVQQKVKLIAGYYFGMVVMEYTYLAMMNFDR